MTKKLLFVLYTLIASFVLLEIVLRIYNPVGVTVDRTGRFLLSKNTRHTVKAEVEGLDSVFEVRRNNLGFLGEDKGADFEQRFSIIAVGGSTTLCLASMEKTWVGVLGRLLQQDEPKLWINNAGIVGHSSEAHLALLRQYIADIQPDMVLFLMGINDLGKNDMKRLEQRETDNKTWKKIVAKSEVLHTFTQLYNENFRTFYLYENLDLPKYKHFAASDSLVKAQLALNTPLLLDYKKRLREIVAVCQQHHIKPVFITQPYLAGVGTDSLTGINLETIAVSEERNGKLFWQILEDYNQQTRDVAAETAIICVDLARKMPKDSRYYIDFMHYNNLGNEKVAALIAEELVEKGFNK